MLQCVVVCRSVLCGVVQLQEKRSGDHLEEIRDDSIQVVAVCCSVLQCVAVCCSVLQCVAVCCSVLQSQEMQPAPIQRESQCFDAYVCCSVLQCIALCCSVLQCVALAPNQKGIAMLRCICVLPCIAVYCSVLQCVAVCCSVLQCAAACCSVLHGVFAVTKKATGAHSNWICDDPKTCVIPYCIACLYMCWYVACSMDMYDTVRREMDRYCVCTECVFPYCIACLYVR